MIDVYIRLYGGLRKFHENADAGKALVLSIKESTSVSDVVTQLGVPLEKVNLTFINNRQQDISYRVQDGDQIAIFPLVAGG